MSKEEIAAKIMLAIAMIINILTNNKIIETISIISAIFLGIFLAYYMDFNDNKE